MKRLILLILLLASVKISQAQEGIERQMTEKAPNCEDIAFNCSQLIERYYNDSNIDSVHAILDYWEDRCGLSEPVFRMNILLAIRDRIFSESLYDSTVIDHISRYSDRVKSITPVDTYLYYKIYFSYIQINGSYDKLTRRIAGELLDMQAENSLEYLFCKLYAGNADYFYNELQSKDKYNGTKLKEYYFKLVNESLKLFEFNIALYSGVWIPFSSATTLGVHPIIGLDAGCKYRKFIFNLSMYLKFAKTPNDYTVVAEDSLWTTDYFFGGYVGLDIEREIIKFGNNEIDFLMGVGYDGFGTLDYSLADASDENDVGKNINSLNINTGLGYRYNFKGHSYLGIRAKYNFVNYKNTGGTDLSGNTASIVVIIGGFSNNKKYSGLKALNYKY
jgi:hypothetical protein